MKKKRRNGRKGAPGSELVADTGATGLTPAILTHIEDLAYERLKDPKYQEWMSRWLEGFLTDLVGDLRSSRSGSEG